MASSISEERLLVVALVREAALRFGGLLKILRRWLFGIGFNARPFVLCRQTEQAAGSHSFLSDPHHTQILLSLENIGFKFIAQSFTFVGYTRFRVKAIIELFPQVLALVYSQNGKLFCIYRRPPPYPGPKIGSLIDIIFTFRSLQQCHFEFENILRLIDNF